MLTVATKLGKMAQSIKNNIDFAVATILFDYLLKLNEFK